MAQIEAPLNALGGIGTVFAAKEVETQALAGVSFDIRMIEYVSISGPSGCGKSPLLTILDLLHTRNLGDYRSRRSLSLPAWSA